jgi:hypothetical protein
MHLEPEQSPLFQSCQLAVELFTVEIFIILCIRFYHFSLLTPRATLQTNEHPLGPSGPQKEDPTLNLK